MTLTMPEWYSGGFDDAEALIRDLLNPALQQIAETPDVYAWLPENYPSLLPLVSIARVNGSGDPDSGLDYPQIHIWSICDNRADSVVLNEFIRQVMFTFRRGGPVKRADGSRSVIKKVTEIVGPELIQATEWDERVIPSVFMVETRKRDSLPTYERIMRDLHK